MSFTIQECGSEEHDWEAWDRLAGTRCLFLLGERLRATVQAGARFCEVREADRTIARFLYSRETELAYQHDPYEKLLNPMPEWRPKLVGDQSPEHNPATPWIQSTRDATGDDPKAFVPAIVFGSLAFRQNPQNYLLFEDSLSTDERVAVLRAIVDHLEGIARETGARSIVFPWYNVEDTQLLRSAAPSLVAAFGYPIHRLHVPASFDEYVASLSKKPRAAVRKALARFGDAGYRTETLSLAEREAEIRTLLGVHQAKYKISDAGGAIVDGAVAEMRLRGAMVFGGVGPRGIIGIAHYITGNGPWIARHAAFLDDDDDDLHAYFNVTYFDPIKAASERGVKTIDVGYWMSRMKVAYGFSASPRFLLVKTFDESLRDLLRSDTLPRARKALQLLAELLDRHGRAGDTEVADAMRITDEQL